MKLNKLHLFLILLLGLVFASLGQKMNEGYENSNTDYSDQVKRQSEDKATYDPFANDSKENKPRKKQMRKKDIPKESMDMYILKSEVVPPVCPKCPDVSVKDSECSKSKKCPPCKPCGRCPEPAFECKKVPNYNVSTVSNVLPVPMLNSFANFN